MNWTDFLPIAQDVVEASHHVYGVGPDVVMGGGGGGSSKYERKGTGVHIRSYDIPQGIKDLVSSNVAATTVDPAIRSLQTQAYTRLIGEVPTTQPGFEQLLSVSSINPRNFVGRAQLEALASLIDPTASNYETRTVEAYRRAAGEAIAQATTGPSFVRGGDARPALAAATLSRQLAENRMKELREARQQDIQAILGAAGGLAQIEAQRMGTVKDAAIGLSQIGNMVGQRNLEAARAIDTGKMQNMQLLQLAAMLSGKTIDTQEDNFSGRGSQENWQAGVSCCFIMYANCRGDKLPWVLEIARVELWTPERRAGYNKMSRFLVPLMKRYKFINNLIGLVMVRPAIRHCEWMYGGKPFGVVDYLISNFWLVLWSVIGKYEQRIRSAHPA